MILTIVKFHSGVFALWHDYAKIGPEARLEGPVASEYHGDSTLRFRHAIDTGRVAQRKDLTEEVRHKLAGHFDGSISWYVTTVKLDLEARGMTERVPRKLHNSFVWLKREADGYAIRGCES